jgi:DNA-binding GntR family transcriptional regulator
MRTTTPVLEDRIEPVTLTNQAYSLIEEEIVTLKLAPGSVVSEVQLSKRLGIGRTPIREALQRLAQAGLVLIMPRRGILVSEINVKSQLQLLEVRREVERLVARSAAERATATERARFHGIADEMLSAAQTDNDLDFLRLDQEFNELSVAAARNEYAANVMRLMQPLSRRFWFIHYQAVADLPLCARLHAEVARAIANGDSAAAGANCDKLLGYIETFTRASLDSPGY